MSPRRFKRHAKCGIQVGRLSESIVWPLADPDQKRRQLAGARSTYFGIVLHRGDGLENGSAVFTQFGIETLVLSITFSPRAGERFTADLPAEAIGTADDHTADVITAHVSEPPSAIRKLPNGRGRRSRGRA